MMMPGGRLKGAGSLPDKTKAFPWVSWAQR